MAKVDIKSAYRMIAVHPDDRLLLVAMESHRAFDIFDTTTRMPLSKQPPSTLNSFCLLKYGRTSLSVNDDDILSAQNSLPWLTPGLGWSIS